MTSEAVENRREHKRVIISAPAVVQTGDDQFKGKILNISAGGAGISMDVQLKDDTRLTVNIEDLGMIPARVVRKLQNGVAVKFEISEEKEERFIEQITEIVELKRREEAKKLA
ncbi:PilZ domain-containing protein [Sneathiella glossodoripedis]|uniref:PilZ domain-containing protein n=1 Tax=Sneathiella glossodoripedis TaxID=418853 RepID=UPI00046FF406|nr:PilZ domain-containing protein [Sneathiella glossodoripedis]